MSIPGFVRCPHCQKAHKLSARHCPETGASLDRRVLTPVGAAVSIIGGKYHVIGRIGAGGMGEVLEAVNINLNRRVAIKVVSPKKSGASGEVIARLRREAAILASLQHPNICDVYDFGELPNGSPYLVLERLVGETLASSLVRQRRLRPSAAVDVFCQILSGLSAAHAAQIVHRDLKPSNVFLVDREGCEPLVKVLDFGFARDLTSNLKRSPITRPGSACGTPAYMSPEQLAARSMDHRSDLFSLGIMLFEALTGRHPFAAESVTEIGIRIARDEPTPLLSLRPSIPPKLAEVVARSLEKDPAARWPSALELQRALRATITRPEDAPESGPLSSTPLPRLWNSSSVS